MAFCFYSTQKLKHNNAAAATATAIWHEICDDYFFCSYFSCKKTNKTNSYPSLPSHNKYNKQQLVCVKRRSLQPQQCISLWSYLLCGGCIQQTRWRTTSFFVAIKSFDENSTAIKCKFVTRFVSFFFFLSPPLQPKLRILNKIEFESACLVFLPFADQVAVFISRNKKFTWRWHAMWGSNVPKIEINYQLTNEILNGLRVSAANQSYFFSNKTKTFFFIRFASLITTT